MNDLISSCKHGIGEIYMNSIGERCLFCEIWDNQRNIDLGDCLGNCESEEPEREVQNEQLKPCPFCGGEAELKDDTLIMPVYDENGAYIDAEFVGGGNIWVECAKCGAQSKSFFIEEEAIEAWNRRVCRNE